MFGATTARKGKSVRNLKFDGLRAYVEVVCDICDTAYQYEHNACALTAVYGQKEICPECAEYGRKRKVSVNEFASAYVRPLGVVYAD